MKYQAVAIGLFALMACSCGDVSEKAKETINRGGEVVGKTATEFIEGVSEGIDKTLECEIVLSPELAAKGLKTGKFSIETDSTGGHNNMLTLYIIFEKGFKEAVTVKAFDKKGLEIGRSKVLVKGKAGDATYYDFKFDRRTYVEVKSKLVIE